MCLANAAAEICTQARRKCKLKVMMISRELPGAPDHLSQRRMLTTFFAPCGILLPMWCNPPMTNQLQMKTSPPLSPWLMQQTDLTLRAMPNAFS